LPKTVPHSADRCLCLCWNGVCVCWRRTDGYQWTV